MLSHPAHPIALGFGSRPVAVRAGHRGHAVGLAGLPAAAPRPGRRCTGPRCCSASLAVGWWACTATARHLGTADPGAIVWDEVIAFWLVLWLVTPAGFWAQAVAFVLFRFFDAAKPGPVAWADKLFKIRRSQPIGWAQGFGILFDDLVAALCTLLVIALWRAW